MKPRAGKTRNCSTTPVRMASRFCICLAIDRVSTVADIPNTREKSRADPMMSISPNMVAVGVALVGYACSRVLQHQCHTTGAGSTRRDSTGSSTAGSLYESRDRVLRDNKSA